MIYQWKKKRNKLQIYICNMRGKEEIEKDRERRGRENLFEGIFLFLENRRIIYV